MNNRDGFLLVDKPQGLSSFFVVKQVRKALNMRKVGHAGTLDPLASGLLVIALGRATRLIPYFLEDKKVYTTTVMLGVASDTLDAEGQLSVEKAPEVSEKRVTKALETFQGLLMQRPPLFSALRINGKRAYEHAREGSNVELVEREVNIYCNQLLAYTFPYIYFRSEVSKGTYIRSLARDLAAWLGTSGTVMTLRRERVGSFSLHDIHVLSHAVLQRGEDISSYVIPTGVPKFSFDKVQVPKQYLGDISLGITIPELVTGYKEGAELGLCSGDHLVAIAKVMKEGWRPRKVFI